ncbi:hypothetical protein PMAYCL1PPCAC_16562, partial [Pristionchus mayeri]
IQPGNGSARILILGNSYAVRAADFLRPMLQPMAKEILLFAQLGTHILTEGAAPYKNAWHRVIEGMKPDVTWVITREPELATKPLTVPIEMDPTFQYARDTLEFISQHSKQVVVDYQSVGSMLFDMKWSRFKLLRRISQGKLKFDDFKVTEEAWTKFNRNETLRMDKIDNSKLIKHRISENQCTAGYCYFYNPANLHVYYADIFGHATSELMELLRPSYNDVIEELKKRL